MHVLAVQVLTMLIKKLVLQQHTWIPVIINRARKSSKPEHSTNVPNGSLLKPSKSFGPLSNLQESVTPTYTRDNQKTTPVKKTEKIKASSLNTHDIITLGDSHMKGRSDKLAHHLDNTCSVTGSPRHNAILAEITSTLSAEINIPSKNDVFIICGRTQDIRKNDSTSGLPSLIHFMK
jgi:hypothetical protein